jgi:PAS domain S-box-containing protein
MLVDDRDIHAAAQALHQAQEINKRIAEHTGDCVKILDLEGRLVFMNQAGLRFLALDESQVLAQPILSFFDGESREQAAAALAAARHGGCGRFQGMLESGSGERRWWDIVLTPITDASGAVVQLLAVSRDITERRRDEALRVAQQQVLGMIATGTALPDVLDRLVRLIEQQADGMLCSVLMLGEDGTHVRHCAAPSLPDDYVRAIDGAPIGPRRGSCGTAMFLGNRVVAADILTDPLWEAYRDVATRAGLRACWSTPIFSPQRQVLGSFAMYYAEPRSPTDHELALIESAADIARIAIEHQRAHQALQQSEARNRAMLRAIPDWMFLTTVDGIFVDYHARETSRLHLPPEAFLGKSVVEVLPPHVSQRLAQAFVRVSSSDEPETMEYVLAAGHEERFFEACIVRCDGDKILSIVRDITDRKRAELETDAQRRALTHLSRVATLGELTGALAHELSQPLTAVRSNAQAARHLLNRDPLDVPELRLAVDDIIRNNTRAGAVIERLRALLRKEAAAFQPVDLNDVVREVLDLAHSEILSRHITVTSTLAQQLRLVIGDRIQLQQVVLNLVLNACDAMGKDGAAARQLDLATDMADGFVQLAVADRGPGIPQSQLDRIFEPFVTFSDQGLGLGLAISRSIVTAHRGSIRAENNAAGGATFRCFLPVADGAAR